MQVKQLIRLLEKFDPESEVFMYNGFGECDSKVVDAVEIFTSGQFYTDGDSEIDLHFEKSSDSIVVLCDPEAASCL